MTFSNIDHDLNVERDILELDRIIDGLTPENRAKLLIRAAGTDMKRRKSAALVASLIVASLGAILIGGITRDFLATAIGFGVGLLVGWILSNI
jgi:hypothetical protein